MGNNSFGVIKLTIMETILVATDFSGAAHNALEYGVELAKFLNAKIVLLYVDQPIFSNRHRRTTDP